MASEQLRNLLGPEDVLLAKRTDPSSIRALYSNLSPGLKSGARNSSKESLKNVAFPMAIQTANCWRETLFWFGPRYTDRATEALIFEVGPQQICLYIDEIN